MYFSHGAEIHPYYIFQEENIMSKKEEKSNIFVLAECAMMVALSIAIFTISDFIPWPAFVQGGSVTLFGQVPVIVLSYRRGIKYGLAGSFVLALFELFMGLANFSYVKTIGSYIIVALFDYIIAYGGLGLGGIFRKSGFKPSVGLSLGAVCVCLLRYICHFISGVTVWRDYTQNLKASAIFSLTYNGSYMLPETVITVIGCVAVAAILKNKIKALISE